MKSRSKIETVSIVFILVLFFTAGFLVFSGLLNLFKGKDKTSQIIADLKKPEITISGIIFTSGLSDDEKNTFKINSDYQLIKSAPENSWEDPVNTYFLYANGLDLSKYLGKCVNLTGYLYSGWENIDKNNFLVNGRWTYDRSAFAIGSVSEKGLTECINDFDNTVKPEEGVKIKHLTFTGILNISKRLSPDINYDFEINIEKIFIDEVNATGESVEQSKLVILPATDELLIEFLGNVGKQVEVGGYMQWGYSESRFLMVDSVIAL